MFVCFFCFFFVLWYELMCVYVLLIDLFSWEMRGQMNQMGVPARVSIYFPVCFLKTFCDINFWLVYKPDSPTLCPPPPHPQVSRGLAVAPPSLSVLFVLAKRNMYETWLLKKRCGSYSCSNNNNSSNNSSNSSNSSNR